MSSNAATPQMTPTWTLMKRLMGGYLPAHKVLLIKAFAFMILAAAMTAAIAQLMQPVLDEVLTNQNTDLIIPVSAAVFVAFFLRGIATYAHTIMMTKISQSIVAQIQKDLFDHLTTLDLAFFHKHPSGQLISRVINDVNAMRTALVDTLTGVGKSLTTLIFLICVMLYQDWKLTLIAFIVLPFAALFVGYIGKRLRQLSGNVQQEVGVLSDTLSQIFQGIRQVKAYGMEHHERNRSASAINKVRNLNIKAVRVGNLSTPVNEILIGFLLMGMIAYGGYQAAAGAMTAGQLGAFLAAFIMAYEPMKKLSRLNNSLQMGLGATERVFAIMDIMPNIQDKARATNLKAQKPEITFDSVSFRYEGADDLALENVSFKAPAGKVTALVGPSGGGKSTIINLIPRLYDVSEGAITINGKNIRDVRIKSLRGHIALVSQDVSIFDDTALANIAYGREDASEEDIMAAAKAAAAHDFIESLPQGYQTVLGENGVTLSGGQRQRISIARAILKDAPILLLDEATSALDNESEQAVQAALKKLEKGRTTIVIAHRLSTVKNAHQILVLDRGTIVEEGKHATLLKKNGLYKNMHDAGFQA